MRILNIHGYHGNSDNACCEALKACKYEVSSPQIDYDKESPCEIIRMLKEIYEKDGCVAVAGTSLGGFFAARVCIEKNCPTFLVNPCLMPFYILPNLGYENMEGMKEYISLFSDIIKIDKSKVSVIIGGQDEVIGSHDFTKLILENEKLFLIPEGKHSGSTLPLKELLLEHGDDIFGHITKKSEII